jgi:hypothetical protein
MYSVVKHTPEKLIVVEDKIETREEAEYAMAEAIIEDNQYFYEIVTNGDVKNA